MLDQADEAWDAEDYATAFDLFSRAHGLVNAPTIAIRQAECLEKLGRLVEASEIYTVTSRLRLQPGAPEQFRRAVAIAVERADASRGRLSTLDLRIGGLEVDGAEVLVDGRKISSVLVGTSFLVDPGDHVVEVVKGNRRASRTITIAEGDSLTIEVVLPPDDQPAGGPTTLGARTTAESSSQATWGWATLGVGIAGITTGGVTGLVAIAQRNSLNDSDSCPSKDVCRKDKESTVNTYHAMRTVSTVGFVVGVVGVGAGLTLLFTAPEPQQREVAGIRPWVGIGSVGVEGTF